MVNEEVTMTMSVLPGAMTGISTLMAGMVSINNVFMDMTRQIDSTFGLVDATVITTGTVIAQFGLKAAEAFGQFEQGMKIVQMVSGQTRDDIAQLSQTANQFSVQYRMDIDQITEGLQTLGRAGLNSASEQSEVLQNGLNTAKLEGRELNSVLEELIQNTALLGGDLKSPNFGEDSGYINDLLVATSMTAPITTHDVSETLKYSGGIAAAAGAKIRTDSGDVNEQGKAILEDYMGAIAAFAQKGVTGSIAGTALRAFFNKPATQDSSVTEALASIKLKPEYLWEDDEETMKPVSQQIKIIQNQMDKLNVSTMDRLQIWSKIVGGKMGQQMMKLESEDIEELTKDIRAADDASSLAAGSMQTFQANMKEMSEQGQVAFREFGSRIATFLNPFIDVVTKILEMLSNPAVSAALFGGFLLAIGKVYSAIRKVLSGLKEEFSDFMNYFRSGETLMAIKPSTERGLKRKGKYTDYKNTKASDDITTVKDLVESYKKVSQGDRLKYLREELGLSDSQIAAREITGKWTSDKLVKGTPDNKIMQYLIDNNKLTNKAFNDIFILSADEWRKKHEKSFKKVLDNLNVASDMVEEMGESTKKNIENYNKRREENKKKWKEENASQGNIGSRDKGPDEVSDENWYTHSSHIINNAKKANEFFENQKSSKEDVKNYNTFYEDLIQQGRYKDFMRYHNMARNDKSFEFPLNLETFGDLFYELNAEDINGTKAIDWNKKDFIVPDLSSIPKGGLFRFGPEFEELKNSLLSSSQAEEVKVFEETVQDTGRVAGESAAAMTKFNQKILDFFIKDAGLSFTENGYGVPLVDEEGLHGKKGVRYGTKAARIPPVIRAILANPGEDVDLNNLPAYDVQKDMDDYLAKHDLDDKGKEVLKSYLGTTHLTGTSQKFFDKKMEELDAYLNPRFNSAEEMKNSGLRIKDINQYIKETYGEDLKLPKNWAKASEIALPYMKDWSKKGNQKGGMTNNEFISFAAGLGADVSGAKNRNEMIEQLNTHLKYRAYTTDQKIGEAQVRAAAVNAEGLEEQIKLEEKLNQFAQEYINLLNEQKRKLDENIAKMQKILELEEKKAISMKGTGGDTTYKYGEDVIEGSKDFRRRRAMEKYSDMVTSSPDQVHEVKDYSDPWGYGALAKEQEELAEKKKNLIKPFKGDGYQEFYEKSLEEQEQETYRVLNEQTGSNYGEPRRRSFSDRIGSVIPSITNPFSGLRDRISNSLFSSATDGLFRTRGTAETLTKTQKLGNAFSNLSNLVGGPLMIAMEAFTLIVNYVQGLYQEYSENIKTLSDNVKNAYSEMSSATDSLKQDYRNQNPNATADDVEQYMLDVYSQRYDDFASGAWADKATIKTDDLTSYKYDEEADDGSYKEKEQEETTPEQDYEEAVKENTGALYAATAQLQTSMSALVNKMNDGMWGIDGLSSKLSDVLGKVQDTNFGFGEGSGFVESGGFLLTASQKDSNYAGYTEMSGLMLENFKDSGGNLYSGLNTMLGKDTKNVLSTMNPKAIEALQGLANFSSNKGPGSLTREQNSRLQQSMKNDKKSWQALGKEIAKVDLKKQKGKTVTASDVRRLEGYIKKLATETGLDRTRILQGAALQQLQDMYAVAQQSMVPLAEQQANIAAEHLVTGKVTQGNAEGADYGAQSTASIASAISAMVAVIAQAKAGEAYWQQKKLEGDKDALESATADEYLKKGIGVKQSYRSFIDGVLPGTSNYIEGFAKGLGGSLFGTTEEQRVGKVKELLDSNFYSSKGDAKIFKGWMMTLETMGEKARNPSWTDEQAQANAERKLSGYFNSDGSLKYNEDVISKIVRENYADAITPALVEQYMGSDIGEVGEGSSGSGGSGGDSEDKDKGNRKERVDLVLCNKKEIPKLNVNLFKKPPTFTVLNKNFKVRDVKINTEDTPKAIMSSIKNAFIDVQKRSDPKIIQDEEAEYDPVAATDGNAVPSGSSKSGTS